MSTAAGRRVTSRRRERKTTMLDGSPKPGVFADLLEDTPLRAPMS